ncbi:MAG: hypothetical protein Tsb0020_33400 [Haliangiales bacterium]
MALLFASAAGCPREHKTPPEPDARLRLWHTFNPAETEALNRDLRAWQGEPVESSMAPFGLGLKLLRETLSTGSDCPDLVRADATWLPGLVADELLAPVPDDLASQRLFLPEADELAYIGSQRYGFPQSLDGLAIVFREDAVSGVAWPPETIDALIESARALTKDNTYGLGLRIDGYWFVPFLRAWGPGLFPDINTDGPPASLNIDSPRAARALARFAELFSADGVAPPPSPPDAVDSDELRRFRDGTLVAVINGPWAVAGLTRGETDGIGVAALPQAPRGGHVWLVPGCAKHPTRGFELALFLTEPARQAEWANQLGVIPTTRAGLDQANPFVRRFHQALTQARPLPRSVITPELFDDLSPAVAAVVSGDADAEEALAGVGRAWRRLLARRDIRIAPPAAEPAHDAGR